MAPLKQPILLMFYQAVPGAVAPAPKNHPVRRVFSLFLNNERSRLLFKKALGREVIVLLLGFGAGVFVLSLLSIGITIWFIKSKGATPWDRYALATSEFAPLSTFRVLLLLPFILAYSTGVHFVIELLYGR